MQLTNASPRPNPIFEEKAIEESQAAIDCAEPMGWTSENVAKDFNISREDMDKWGLASHNRASDATKTGRFLEEIIPIETQIHEDAKDKSSPVKPITVTEDDGIRHGMTMEKMVAAKPAFTWGNKQSTGPNTSQMTDGAAMAVLMKRSTAEKLGQPILATYITTATVGVTPKYMGIGPVPAITKALDKAGITKDDVSVFEINEAFSSMMVYTTRELGLDPAKVNPNGGAIALGHPLGATGVRQVVTGIHEIIRRNQSEKGPKILVTSMCVGECRRRWSSVRNLCGRAEQMSEDEQTLTSRRLGNGLGRRLRDLRSVRLGSYHHIRRSACMYDIRTTVFRQRLPSRHRPGFAGFPPAAFGPRKCTSGADPVDQELHRCSGAEAAGPLVGAASVRGCQFAADALFVHSWLAWNAGMHLCCLLANTAGTLS